MNASTSVSVRHSPGRGKAGKKGQRQPPDLEVCSLTLFDSFVRSLLTQRQPFGFSFYFSAAGVKCHHSADNNFYFFSDH